MIVAIDDDPGRYDYFKMLCEDKGIPFKVVACEPCIRKYLPEATGILLDYDLDTETLCAECGGWVEQVQSTQYVPLLNRMDVPVAISSCSYHVNRKYLYQILDVTHKVLMPAWDQNVEHMWIGWLYMRGCLP